MPLHRRLPKRGFNNPGAIHLNEVNVGRIQQAIDAGKLDASAPVTLEALIAAGVVSKARDGVKILGVGELTAKLTVQVSRASKSAAPPTTGSSSSASRTRRRPRPAIFPPTTRPLRRLFWSRVRSLSAMTSITGTTAG